MKGCAEFVFESEHAPVIYQALAPELEDELHRSNVLLGSGRGFYSIEDPGRGYSLSPGSLKYLDKVG